MTVLMSIALAAASLPPAKQEAIKVYFDADLIDGPSARWKWPDQKGNKNLYCGWLNAKNRLGGYTGWTPYFVMFEGGKVKSGRVLSESEGVITEIFSEICAKDGYDMTSPPRD